MVESRHVLRNFWSKQLLSVVANRRTLPSIALKGNTSDHHIIVTTRGEEEEERYTPPHKSIQQHHKKIIMKDTLISICSSVGVLTVASLGYKYSQPTNQEGGVSSGSGATNNLKAHVIYALCAISTIFCLPAHIAQYIFTELTVSFIGALYPVYRATRAVYVHRKKMMIRNGYNIGCSVVCCL